MNNLKLKVKERADKVAKYCEHCKRETHDTQDCWFKDKHKNERSVQNGNTFQGNRGYHNTQTRPYKHNFRQQHGFQARGYQGNSGYNNSDFYDYNYPYAFDLI